MEYNTKQYLVQPGELVKLEEQHTRYEGELQKNDGKEQLKKVQKELLEQQQLLHADGTKSLLIVLQAMDAGGKDSTIRRTFGPLNPNWCRVHSFAEPTENELARDFLWRIHRETPPAGSIEIFNRSHYEDVIVAKVRQLADAALIEKRFEHINNFEKLLYDEGTRILKFYLHISKDYQKERLERRLRRPDKHWKFDPRDLEERKRWGQYHSAYETVLSRCSTWYAPWYVIPAERRWYRDLVIAEIVKETLESMQLSYPEPDFNPQAITIE